jgi:hypothetical protein
MRLVALVLVSHAVVVEPFLKVYGSAPAPSPASVGPALATATKSR